MRARLRFLQSGYIRSHPRGRVQPWKMTISPLSSASLRMTSYRANGFLLVTSEEVYFDSFYSYIMQPFHFLFERIKSGLSMKLVGPCTIIPVAAGRSTITIISYFTVCIVYGSFSYVHGRCWYPTSCLSIHIHIPWRQQDLHIFSDRRN